MLGIPLILLLILVIIIIGQAAYAPNPKNWAHEVDVNISGGIQNYTDSIYNAYVQNNRLNRQEFTFGVWSAKIHLSCGQGMISMVVIRKWC